MNKKAILHMLGLALMLFLLTSCDDEVDKTPITLGVDQRLREFYSTSGGAETVGLPVGDVLPQGDTIMQVFENAIIVYNPSAAAGEQVGFLKLGHNFVTEDPALRELVVGGQTQLNGHVVFDEFLPMFQGLGGVRFVGNPLTSVRKNDEQGRYEQYFENLGFYRLYTDPPGQARLLPYGLYECTRNLALNCKRSIAPPADAIVSEPLLVLMKRLNNLPGKPLSPLYLAPDGKYEQIYENVVVEFDVQNPRVVGLRPLPALVGIKPRPFEMPLSNPDFFFVEIQPNLGYNVRRNLLEFIAAHGGPELSGKPISALFDNGGLQLQCFENYCLIYDAARDVITPANLGHQYLKLQSSFSAPKMTVRTWEEFQYIAPGQNQVVSVVVFNQESNTPMVNLQPALTLTLPDQSQAHFVFPPTSADGKSVLEIGGISLSGTVAYQVCVSWPGSAPLCVGDSWIVQ
jgi:hypothetical protein